MCFSAAASIASGVVLSGAGVVTQRVTRKPELRLFASIPLIFALQQFAEGVVWITLNSGVQNGLQTFSTHVYLTAALVIWPIFVPLSILIMEKRRERKLILLILLITGAIVSTYNAFNLIHYQVTPQIQQLHIQYNNNFPSSLGYIPILYGISTIIPFFASSVKKMWLLGIAISVSLLVAIIFFTEFVTSIWCFFAAILSTMIYWIIKETQKGSDLNGITSRQSNVIPT